MHAEKLDNVTSLPAPPQQGMASVLQARPDGTLELHDGQHTLEAKTAASCLLRPQEGDRVWVVGEAGQGHYVIAVLERSAEAPAVLGVPGDLAIRAEGTVTLSGGEGLQLHTPQAMAVSADALHVRAREGRTAIEQLTVLSRAVFASLKKVTRVGAVLELLVERVTQRSTHSVRSIAGIDRTQAQTIDYRAAGDAHIQATHALVNGKDLVKMDGGQIHLG